MVRLGNELAAYIGKLRDAERIPLPEHGEEWKDHVQRISVPGRSAAINEEQYYYWLEVLPPKFQHASVFCFAEGAEPFRLFWQESGGRYLTRQLTRAETARFCALADIPEPW